MIDICLFFSFSFKFWFYSLDTVRQEKTKNKPKINKKQTNKKHSKEKKPSKLQHLDFPGVQNTTFLH